MAQVIAVEPLRDEPSFGSDAVTQKERANFEAVGAPPAALQDLALLQHPLMVGLISSLMGEALQESLASVTDRLVEQGQRWLAKNPHGLGHGRATANSNSC